MTDRNMILFGPWNRGDGTRVFPVCDLCGNAVARTLLLSSPRGPLFEICEACLSLANEKIAEE